jgi:hypothetical protein
MDKIEADKLKPEIFNLIAFMITSASGLYEEPPEYGSFRLIDSAGRLLSILQAAGWDDPFLAKLKEEVDAECSGSMDNQRQRESIERWVLMIANQMRQQFAAK